jgi:release factor glutamine methyltransferase
MSVSIKTINDIRSYISNELKGIYPDYEIIALSNIIIKTVTGSSKLHLLALPEQRISQTLIRKITNICTELKTGKPIQYIFGETTFYNCYINLSEATLIPRQETEELVDLIIKENRGFKGNITDIGTGSGCIAIALAANLPGSSVTGIDISAEALKIAEKNSRQNNVPATFIEADIFSFDKDLIAKTNIIVSNPPYVREKEKQFMNKNVIDFEPHSALFVPDSDPLVYYRRILEIAEQVLMPAGKIYFEINEAFGRQMIELLQLFNYTDLLIIKDINNKARIIKGIRHA